MKIILLYFLLIFNQITLENGLVLDHKLNPKIVSCSATGFVSYSRASLIAQNIAPRSDITKIKSAFRTTIQAHPEAQGWLYHFTDIEGKNSNSEISTIDTAIFYFSFKLAAKILKDQDFIDEVNLAIRKINLKLMMVGPYFRHGAFIKNGEFDFIEELWDDYNEGVILYDLFNLPFTAKEIRYDLPLFVYYYPIIFSSNKEYVNHLMNAISFQEKTYGYIGVTACDSPYGYQVNDPKIISPLSVYACQNYIKNDINLPLVNSMTEDKKWQSEDIYGIDWGSSYLMIYETIK